MIKYWAGVVLLGLAACAAPTLKSFDVNTFQNERPIALAVGDVQVNSHLTTYDRLPHIETKMPVTPEQALTRWAENRFYGARMSSPVDMVINITDAYMTQSKQPSDKWYQLDNVRYRLTYKLDVQFKKGTDVLHTQNVTGWESVSIPQKSSLADKEEAWQTMLNTMIDKVNRKVITDIPSVYKD